MSLFQPGYLPAMMLAGKVFTGSTTNTGVAIPAYNATAQVFGLWNPAGSGVNVILVKLQLAIATLGTNIVGAMGLSYIPNTGSAIGATGSPLTAFAQTASIPGLIGIGGGGAAPSQARFTLSATTIAPTFYYSLGMTSTTGTPTDSTPVLTHDFDGSQGVAPGTYIGLGGSAAPGSTYQGTITWIEVPVSGS